MRDRVAGIAEVDGTAAVSGTVEVAGRAEVAEAVKVSEPAGVAGTAFVSVAALILETGGRFPFGRFVQRCRRSILLCRRPARRFLSPFGILNCH